MEIHGLVPIHESVGGMRLRKSIAGRRSYRW